MNHRDHTLSFPSFFFQLRTLTPSDLRTWVWKLDPWRNVPVSDAQDSLDIVTVKLADSFGDLTGSSVLLQRAPMGFFERRIWKQPDGSTLWQLIRIVENRVYLEFRVSVDWTEILQTVDETRTEGMAAFEFLAQMLPGICLKKNILPFHGVLMEHQGQGIIISANSGVGKTTHARLWRDHRNALIINGDRAVCKKTDGVWKGFGLPWSGSSGEQINRSAPLRALVVLERSDSNEAHRISGMEAFGAMLPHVQCPSWDAALTGTAMELMDDLLREIPVLRLRCRPDVGAVEALERALEAL